MSVSLDSLVLLVGVYDISGSKVQCNFHLDELEDLAKTFGFSKSERIVCSLKSIDPATYITKGKLEEVRSFVVDHKVGVVIFDEELSLSQQNNLEKKLQVTVMDRTWLILEIFAQRARTREATLQIELARSQYLFPRLKRLWGHLSRQRARGGYLKGEGEKQIELDRRLLKSRIQHLTKEIDTIKRSRQTQKKHRGRTGIFTFAIIGYTNVGKSTLLNALTDAGVLVEDKLFATLDPVTRKFKLPNGQEVLLTDTVGFVRKLPHTLVAAFRSTMESALHDDVLLHLVDVSHPLAVEHSQTTYELLKELNVKDASVITVLNKADLCTDKNIMFRLRTMYPKTVIISAKEKSGLDDLIAMMQSVIASKYKDVELRIPQSEYSIIAILHREGEVIAEEYEGNDVIIHAKVPENLMERFESYMKRD